MKTFLIALGLGAATLVAAAPADAQPGYRDGYRHSPRYQYHGGQRWERGPGWNRGGHRWRGRHDYRNRYYYRQGGRRYYGWR